MKTWIWTAVLATVLVAGCAGPQTRYAWNGYRDHLYDAYDNKITQDELLTQLEGALEESTHRGVKVGPGVYADIGTLYVQKGMIEKGILYYKKEAETWPESAHFMNTLIQNLERKQNQKE